MFEDKQEIKRRALKGSYIEGNMKLAFSFNVCVPDKIRSLKTDFGLNFDYETQGRKLVRMRHR